MRVLRSAPTRILVALAASLVSSLSSTASAENLTIHSDVPLWTNDEKAIWPKHFSEGDSFGCVSNIAFGDWRLTYRGPNHDSDDVAWIRFANYGVFHCFIVEYRSEQPEDLDSHFANYSVLVDLGDAHAIGKDVELYALQSGVMPGSTYLLLSSPKVHKGVIKAFDVLRTDCPKQHIRGREAVEILFTKYCAINSQRDLRSLALRMAKLPPAATLEFVDREEGESKPGATPVHP